jgi:hypothetical protein
MFCPLCSHFDCALFFEKKRHFFRCSHCELIFVPAKEQPTKAEEHSRYEQHENELLDSGYAKFLARSLDQIPLSSYIAEEILDYGYGKNRPLATLLAKRGFSAKSYDLYFHKEDKLLSQSYGLIFCLETAEHFRNPFQEFAKLFSLLKSGGAILLRTEFPPENFAEWYYHRDFTHLAFYSMKTFQYLAKLFHLQLEYCESPYVFLKKY